MYTVEQLQKMNNTELLVLIDKYAKEAENQRLILVKENDKFERIEQNYMLAIDTLNRRINPDCYDENGDLIVHKPKAE